MTDIVPEGSKLLDAKSAAKYIGFAPTTLAAWRWNKRFDLRPVKFGRRIRYLQSELDKFILEQMRPQ